MRVIYINQSTILKLLNSNDKIFSEKLIGSVINMNFIVATVINLRTLTNLIITNLNFLITKE